MGCQNPDCIFHRLILYLISHWNVGRHPEREMRIAHISRIIFGNQQTIAIDGLQITETATIQPNPSSSINGV